LFKVFRETGIEAASVAQRLNNVDIIERHHTNGVAVFALRFAPSEDWWRRRESNQKVGFLRKRRYIRLLQHFRHLEPIEEKPHSVQILQYVHEIQSRLTPN
jgi:hypothetical protein